MSPVDDGAFFETWDQLEDVVEQVLSHVQGASWPPLIEETIGACFDRIATAHAAREALVVPHQQIRWSYAELKHRVDRLAAALLRLGLSPGDRLGVLAPNCAEWVVVQLATAKAGIILVTINPAYRTHELEYALTKVECRALVLIPSYRATDYAALLSEIAPEIATAEPGSLHAARLPALRFVIALGDAPIPGMLAYEDLVDLPGDEDVATATDLLIPALAASDPINIQFTSGTTGSPKGATLTHRNILNNGLLIGHAMRLSCEDRLCIPVPLHHCFGMVIGNLAGLTHGATLILPGEGFDAEATLATVDRERCTVLHGVPTMFVAMLEAPGFADHDLSSLRTGVMAGAPCPIELMRKVIDRMHMAEITIAYGMTETAPISFQSAVDDPLERRVATVGRVHPHVEVRIVDPEGATVPRGVPGELVTRGYSVMRGYWGDPERTAESIDADGWMHSGDLATIDAEGFCNIVGRAKDMVIRGGENIYPREIEEYLHRHPAIQDVHVVGVPDERYGEELCAFVQLRAGYDASAPQIRDFCHGRIAHFKIPKHVRFVSDFPMTASGKVRKSELRSLIAEELGVHALATA